MENYEFVCQIGKGNFGRISKIIRKSDQKTLIWKELDYGQMSEKEKEQIVSEVNILRELKHPNIVRYYDRIIDKKHSRIYIIMEYCEGGDLNQLIKRCKKTGEFIAEDIIWKIFTQVLLAIHVIHNHKEGKILHRDIKPSNIFLDKDNNVKLGDFGLSRELSDQSKFAYSHVGTPYYMSPEQIDETKYNEKSDIWSLGCFLYELTTFHPPFEAKNQIMLAMRIKSGKVEKINKRYSEELWRVITWMLTVNYNNRPSSEELLNIPEVCIRLREKRIKDTLYKLKIYEEKLNIKDKEQKEREEKLNEKEKNLKEKENELKDKEKELKEKENELKEKENELKEKEKKFKNLSTLSNANTTGYSSKFLSSKNSNDLNNMNNSNNNSNSNNHMSNNIDVYSIKNNIINNMINNNSDLNSLLMYSTKNNSSNNNNSNTNTNNLLMTANTNTSLNNISLLNNNNRNNNGSINNNLNSLNNNYLLTNNLNEDNKNSSQKNIEGLADEYSNHNFDTNTKNNYIHYSSNNIYSDYLNNKLKTSTKNISDNLNDSEIKNDFTKIKNNLNASNISNSSTINKNNISGSFINSLKKKISNSFINTDNSFINVLNKEKQKYNNNTNEEKNIYEKRDQANSFAKKINDYENNSNINSKNESNINLNRTMKYNIKNNKFQEKDSEIDTTNQNYNNINNINNINNVKSEKSLDLFNGYDNYTNLISQINNINIKYGIPSKISLSNKTNYNKNNYDNSNNDIINNSNVNNNINNFNPNLIHKSNKNSSSNRSSLSNNLSNISSKEKNNTNLKTVKNINRGNGINNSYKYNTNNSAYDFEIANKIGYETGRPSTHCGIIETFTNNDINNTTINNINRNNLKDNRINTLRNNVKRAKTPKINKIPARCFDNVTALKYETNEGEENIINRVEKIDYGIHNYLTNLNDNSRTMNNNSNNNNNYKKLYTKQVENKSQDKIRTINNSCRNKSGTFTSYKKKK